LRTDKKKGVPFKMMFRHHKDPSYYDPRANDKIFVPDVSEKVFFTISLIIMVGLDRIVETFPERDRGIFKEGDTVVEDDPLEAVVKKMKLKKKEKKKVRFDGDDDENKDDEDEDDDVIEDSEEVEDGDGDGDEEEYDEEDESEEEVKEVKPKKPTKDNEDAN
jgi:hypothetical protein